MDPVANGFRLLMAMHWFFPLGNNEKPSRWIRFEVKL